MNQNFNKETLQKLNRANKILKISLNSYKII